MSYFASGYIATGFFEEETAGSAPAGDHIRKRRKRKHYNNLFDSIQDVLAEEAAKVDALPKPPRPTPKRKKHIARQIVVAAGKSDLLPVLSDDTALAIGTEAIKAAEQKTADLQAQYERIAALVAELERMAEDEDEDDVEFLLLA